VIPNGDGLRMHGRERRAADSPIIGKSYYGNPIEGAGKLQHHQAALGTAGKSVQNIEKFHLSFESGRHQSRHGRKGKAKSAAVLKMSVGH